MYSRKGIMSQQVLKLRGLLMKAQCYVRMVKDDDHADKLYWEIREELTDTRRHKVGEAK